MQKLPPVLIFLIVSLLIVFSWFWDGLYIGGAEVGLSPFYNPARYLNIQQYIWWADVAPGVLVPQFVNAVPLYFMLSIFQNFFSPLFLQAMLFLVLLFLMGIGMYLYTLYLLGKDKKVYAVIAGLFYMFNSYMMVEVWHRFLYTGIFLAAAIPILILFWQKWIRTGKLVFLIIFLFVNLAFSYMYGNLTSAISVWGLCALISFAEMVLPWQGRRFSLNIALKFITGFFLFLLTNLWWLIPVLNVSTQVLPEQHSSEDNIGTLFNISKQTILPYVLQYANPFYLFYAKELGQAYTSFFFLILPWIPASVIFVGLFYALKKKALTAVALLYILAVVIAKGAASPWGYPYIWGFMKVFFLGIIRNPFEKLGILLPLFGSILFVVGLESIFLFSRKKYGNSTALLIVAAIFLSVLIYAFPMFTGRVFNKPDYSLKVKVPRTYEQANEWFKKQEDKRGNIIHLPFSGGDVGTYSWQDGYHGVEVNEILFTELPSITRNASIKRVDETLKSLTYIFTTPYSEDKKTILRALQRFNVNYIVLHKDIAWSDKNTYGEKTTLINPLLLENILNNLDFLKKEQQFGDLVIYKLKDLEFRDIVSIPSHTQIVYPGRTDIMQILSLTNPEQDIITPLADVSKDFANDNFVIFFPDKIIKYQESTKSATAAQVNEVFNGQLLGMRNYFYSVGYLQSLEIINDLISSTEKILFMYQQSAISNMSPSSQQITDYRLLMKKIFDRYTVNSSINQLFEEYIRNDLKIHLLIMKALNQSDIAKMLEDFMVKVELLPVYSEQLSSQEIDRKVFKFKISRAGFYQLLPLLSLEDRKLKVNGEKVASIDDLPLEATDYEISIDILDNAFNGGIALKRRPYMESSSSGKVAVISRESPVKYSGKIHLDNPSFILFSQSFHPGWKLSLFKDDKQVDIKEHLLGNLYGNAWWVNDQGNFDFKIEFEPQKTVTTGVVLSGLGWVVILAAAGMSKLRKKA